MNKEKKTLQGKFEFNHLIMDMLSPITSMKGLVNLTENVYSKKEAKEICIRLKECSQKLDMRIAMAIKNIVEGKRQL